MYGYHKERLHVNHFWEFKGYKKKTVKVKETVMPHRWESIKYQRVDNENWPQLGVSNLTF